MEHNGYKMQGKKLGTIGKAGYADDRQQSEENNEPVENAQPRCTVTSRQGLRPHSPSSAFTPFSLPSQTSKSLADD